jgi:hypothetical protein
MGVQVKPGGPLLGVARYQTYFIHDQRISLNLYSRVKENAYIITTSARIEPSRTIKDQKCSKLGILVVRLQGKLSPLLALVR